MKLVFLLITDKTLMMTKGASCSGTFCPTVCFSIKLNEVVYHVLVLSVITSDIFSFF